MCPPQLIRHGDQELQLGSLLTALYDPQGSSAGGGTTAMRNDSATTDPTRSNIARIRAPSSAAAQALMKDAIALWESKGLHVAGLVEETHGLPDRVCNAGILRDIVTGSTYSIYLETPPSGKTCHIDPRGAERACTAVLERIGKSDLVVLSKFGKLEASRGGLFRAFAAAIEAGMPVLTTVSGKHLSAWREFAPNAVTLPADIAALEGWYTAVSGRGANEGRAPDPLSLLRLAVGIGRLRLGRG
jgi:hypothetical protein